jgi:hypothetical protein
MKRSVRQPLNVALVVIVAPGIVSTVGTSAAGPR